MKKTFLVAVLPLLLFACAGSSEKSNWENAPSSAENKKLADLVTNNENSSENIPSTITEIPEITSNIPQQLPDTTGSGGSIIANKKNSNPTEKKEENAKPVKQIIQTADIKIQVNNLDHTADTVEILTKKYGAYVSSSSQQSDNTISQAKISIRVSQENFTALIRDLMKQSQFTNFKNIHTDDVTAEYVDIESRLKTKKEVETRYLEILRNNAHTVKEILLAENEIRVIHEEIEAKTGRLNFIRDQAAYSTINLEYYVQTSFSKEPDQVKFSWTSDMSDAFGSGWAFCKKLVVVLTYFWPLYLVLLIVFIVLKKTVLKKSIKTV